MDDSLLSDPRARRLMALTGVSLKQLIGTLYLVWLPCYTRKSPNLPKDEVDICADHDGWLDAMLKSKLAIDNGDGTVYMVGAEERLAFLHSQQAKGRASAAARARQREELRALRVGTTTLHPGPDPGQTRAQPGTTGDQPVSTPVQPSSPDLDLDLVPDLSLDRQRSARASKPRGSRKSKAPSAEHRAAAERIWDILLKGRQHAIPGARVLTKTDRDLDRICERLAEGYTEEDAIEVIREYTRRAKRDPGQAEWFDGVTPFRPDNFARALGKVGIPEASSPARRGGPQRELIPIELPVREPVSAAEAEARARAIREIRETVEREGK